MRVRIEGLNDLRALVEPKIHEKAWRRSRGWGGISSRPQERTPRGASGGLSRCPAFGALAEKTLKQRVSPGSHNPLDTSPYSIRPCGPVR